MSPAITLMAADLGASFVVAQPADDHPVPMVGLHFCLLESDDVPRMKALITDALVPLGFNTLVVDLSYSGFKFQSDAKVAADPRWEKWGITAEQAREIGDLCRANGIRVVPYFNNMGHQNAQGGPDARNSLLTQYPEFLLGGPSSSPSWNSMVPEIYPIILGMIDEVIDAFGADAFHVGMDEVYRITSEDDPRTRGKDPAALFAKVVNLLHAHIVGARNCEMFMWQDTIAGWHQGETMRRVADMIPKDIVICNWDYGDRPEYPDVRWFQEKGFRVMTGSWNGAAATRSLIRYSQRNDLGNLVGHLYTNWETSYCRSHHLRAALLGEGDQGALPAPSRGVAEAILDTVELLQPGPRYSIDVTTPSTRGMLLTDESVTLRASINEDGVYGSTYTAVVASLVLYRETGEIVRTIGEVRSTDEAPTEFSIDLSPGTYRLRLRGAATRADGSREEFSCGGPELRLVSGDVEAALLAADLERHAPLLPLIDAPPSEGRALLTVSAADLLPTLSANNAGWLSGGHPSAEPLAVGVVFPGATASQPGDQCSITASVDVPDFTGRLHAQLFRADGYSNPEWPGYRFYQLLVDDDVVWEEDVTFEETEYWVDVDITDAARPNESTELTLRIVDRQGVGHYGTASLLGPVLLIELP